MARAEIDLLEGDTALVRELERHALTYDWQRRILERATERVDLRRRALLAGQREDVTRLLERVGYAGPAEPVE